MQHYKLVKTTLGDMATNYPHSPEDQPQSYEDYLEDMLSQGFELVTFSHDSSWIYLAFKVVAK